MRAVHLPSAKCLISGVKPAWCAVVSINADGSADVIPLASKKLRRGYAAWHLPNAAAVMIEPDHEPEPCLIDDGPASARAALYSEAYLSLKLHSGNRTLAAKYIGISRQAMTDRIRTSGWLETLFPHRDGRPAKG